MKNIFNLFILLILMSSISSCNRIDAGYTGIKFNHYGITDEKGISKKELVSGTVFYNPFTQSVYEYPHFWQDVEYENVCFNSSEGEPICADLKVIYRFVRSNIPKTFDEYRESPKKLRHGIFQSIVLEELSTKAGVLSAVNIMGRERDKLLTSTKISLNETYGSQFEFDLVTFTSELTPSENVKNSIQGVIQAQEKAKSAEAHTLEVEEQAKQEIIDARADSTARVIMAAGKAKEIQLIQDQLRANPKYIDYIKASVWNGELTKVSGATNTFMDISNVQ